jgi:iron(III) transport system ATP-binding protein
MASVRLDGVTKSFARREVVRDMSVTIRDGECFTFLGPSGCGKTVVLRLIAGFERPDRGTIRIGDTVVADAARDLYLPPERRRIGVVFQDYAVWPHKTVFENVVYPLQIQRAPRDEAKRRADEAIALVNLEGYAERLPYQLSGGQQQRVALARALVSRPSIMLLDEPLSNLDANLREEMRFEIKTLQRRTGVTILYVTHDQEVALALSDRVAIMDAGGAIRQIGSPGEVFESPADRFVFQFLGVCNFVPLESRGGRPHVLGSDAIVDVPVPAEHADTLRAGGVIAGCRPGDVRIVAPDAGTRGLLRRATYLGATMDYRVDLGSTEIRVQEDVRDALRRGQALREGDPVGLEFLDLKWFAEGEARASTPGPASGANGDGGRP